MKKTIMVIIISLSSKRMMNKKMIEIILYRTEWLIFIEYIFIYFFV